MQTIDRECFNKKWIIDQAKRMRPVDPVQLEKSIYAFELLGRLADAGIPFVFKGGTCVLLKTNHFKRLSIDIDICSKISQIKMDKILTSIGVRPPFLGCNEKKRQKGGLPKRRHYYFSYTSNLSKETDHVILDVLDEESHYDQIEKELIKMSFFKPDHNIKVDVPSFNCLLADKLTAFAPGTIGVKYDMDNSIQIIKQLFDVGELFDHLSDISIFKSTYAKFYKVENGYRKHVFSMKDVLEDTIFAGLMIAELGLNIRSTKKSEVLKDGINRIQSHLVDCKFGLPQAIISAGKAALLARLIQNDKKDISLTSLKYTSKRIREIADLNIKDEWAFINKLKGTNPEAFFYWYSANQL